MRILVTTWLDASCIAIENVIRELKKRGHYLEVYAFYYQEKCIYIFEKQEIPVHPASELCDSVFAKFDIGFTVDSAMRAFRRPEFETGSSKRI